MFLHGLDPARNLEPAARVPCGFTGITAGNPQGIAGDFGPLGRAAVHRAEKPGPTAVVRL